MFSVFKGVHENVVVEGEDVMRLVTLRSHDQYNTTIYAMDDRYRGVFGRRDVLFMNEQDMAAGARSMAIGWISTPRCRAAH